MGIVIHGNFCDPWPGMTSRKDAEEAKAKNASNGGDNGGEDEESGGRKPRYARCWRRVCVGCPRLRVPTASQAIATPVILASFGVLACATGSQEQCLIWRC